MQWEESVPYLITSSDCIDPYGYTLSLSERNQPKSGYIECRSCSVHIPKEELCVKVNSIYSYDTQLFQTMMLSFCLKKQCLQNQPLHKQRTKNRHHYPDFNGKLTLLCKVISLIIFILFSFFVNISDRTIE
jgi:hypothetical protein